MFYREFTGINENQDLGEDSPYELKLPEGYKGKSIFSSHGENTMYVNASDADGKMKTLACGNYRGWMLGMEYDANFYG